MFVSVLVFVDVFAGLYADIFNSSMSVYHENQGNSNQKLMNCRKGLRASS